jgi:hypothetical protein
MQADPEMLIRRLRVLRTDRDHLLEEVASHESAERVLVERLSSQQLIVERAARSKGFIKVRVCYRLLPTLLYFVVTAHTACPRQVGVKWQIPKAAPTEYKYTVLKRELTRGGEDDEVARRKERHQRRCEADATSKCVHLEGVQAVLQEDTQRMRSEAMSLETLVAAGVGAGDAETSGSRLQREVKELSEELALLQQAELTAALEVRRQTEALELRIDTLQTRVRHVRGEGQGARGELGEQLDTLRKLDSKTAVLRSRLARLNQGQVPWQGRVSNAKGGRS